MSRIRSFLFFNPVKSSTAVWVGSSLPFLIPACLKLAPLGDAKNKAKDVRNAAQDAVDSTENALSQTEAQITLEKQRVADIGCAIKGYQSFNDRISSFWAGIASSTLSPSGILDTFWNLSIVPDSVTQETQSVTKTYDETTYVLQPVQSCSEEEVGNSEEEECTTTYQWVPVTTTYDYTEKTTITYNDTNILQGVGIAVLPLNCGFYSRSFQTLDPALFVVSTTNPEQTGSKESGTVNIAYTENRGSEVPADFFLDGSMTNATIFSPTTASQSDALLSVAEGLFSFATTALGVFNVTGANYPQIQIQIQNNITSLTEQADLLNQTLQLQQATLNQAQGAFKIADKNFHEGLSLWLPLLFVVPAALAVATHRYLSGRADPANENEEQHKEAEMAYRYKP